MSARYRCDECGWIGSPEEFQTARHPFIAGDSVQGCPKCGEIGGLTELCDEPGCTREATCGWPSPSGYRRTCHEHWEWEDK